MSIPPTEFEEFVDPVDGTRWLVDIGFLGSRWRCIWGEGCEGILDHPAAELQQGCCSVGAELLDEDEAMRLAALAATLPPELFQFKADAEERGIFGDDSNRRTAIVSGACIFLNRPGFPGGAGCALHLGAEADDEAPMEWKPAVCWQLPLKVDRDDRGPSVLRRWGRSDWGSGGAAMAWCCTEEAVTYDGTLAVARSLGAELCGLVGPDVAVAIQERVSRR